MPTPAEILERNAQQAKAAAAGGGKAHEGGGLLADADYEVSEDSEMVKESNAFWLEKFSLKICGRNLSAETTRKLLIAGSALLCAMVLVTIVSVNSATAGSGQLDMTDKAKGLMLSGVVQRVDFVVGTDDEHWDENALEDTDRTWITNFERDLATALNNEDRGLPCLGTADDPQCDPEHVDKCAQWRTMLRVHAESQIAVGSIVDTDTVPKDPCEGTDIRGKTVSVLFAIDDASQSASILRVLDMQRPTKSGNCPGHVPGPSPLMRGDYTGAILDIDVPRGVGLIENDDTQLRRYEGAGSCTGSGRSICGNNADCINTANGHECVCRSGYERGEGTTCVAKGGGTVAAGGISESRRSENYLILSKDNTGTQCTDGDCSGMETWRLRATLTAGASNIYAIFGQEDHPLTLPPAFQVAPPFGTYIGGVNPLLISTLPGLDYDSWVTIGETEGAWAGKISTIGIDWSCWSHTDQSTCDDRGGELEITDGAVFWMNPDDGPNGAPAARCPGDACCPGHECPIDLAQITVPTGLLDTPVVRFGAQGRHSGRDADTNWETGQYPLCWCLGNEFQCATYSGCA